MTLRRCSRDRSPSRVRRSTALVISARVHAQVAMTPSSRSHSALLPGRGNYTTPADHEIAHYRQTVTATPAVT